MLKVSPLTILAFLSFNTYIFIASERIAPTDNVVTLKKKYNKAAKEKSQLKKELDEVKKLGFFTRLKNFFK